MNNYDYNIINSVEERVDRFFNDIENKYSDNILWMKIFFDLVEKRNNYYKNKFMKKIFQDRG